MNIEEERKAFDEWEKSGMSDIGPWQAWLAAKAHAEEMAKPACNVWETMSDEWRVVHAGEYRNVDQVHTHWPTQAAALQWAKDNGYRVVSE